MSRTSRLHQGLVAGFSILVLARCAEADLQDTPGAKTDRESRYERQRAGATPDEWARRLEDPQPEVRLETVKSLAESNDPKAHDLLMQAVEDRDPRVATTAVDALGRNGAKYASSFLAQHLFLAGTSPGLRQRILIALGRIHDPTTARLILEFIRGDADPQLRGTAIRVIGEIDDGSTLADLRRFAEQEKDGQLKTLANDAVTRIEARQARTESAGAH
ncbi:MAG: HEAT repeat domain-containing protein [Candidatus Binatia bacterium]